MNVKTVIAGDFGPGASALLEEHGINMLKTTLGELVVNTLKNNFLIK